MNKEELFRIAIDFGRLFGGIFAGKGMLALGYNVPTALAVAAVVPIVVGELNRYRSQP